MEILVYILVGVATFFVMSFLMARFGSEDPDDIFCVSLGCAFIWPIAIIGALICGIIYLIGWTANANDWPEKWKNRIDRIRNSKKNK
jgi:predicted membrane channel-forming protein YqfA (hemolysin III family)